jgi:hypothetical protein
MVDKGQCVRQRRRVAAVAAGAVLLVTHYYALVARDRSQRHRVADDALQ